MLSIIYLISMSIVAGILTGIVGMASLTLYPVLISVGIPPISANATITVSQVAAGISTVLSSLKDLKGHWKQAINVAIVNTVAGVIGALLLIHSSNTGFKKLVPIFIFLAGIMILIPNQKINNKRKSKLFIFISWLGVFLVGIYNGYFGAGSGLLMIAVLSKLINNKYTVYNSIRNFASFTNNVVAAIIFIFMLPIAWKIIIPLLIGLFVGGYIGPIIVRYIPSNLIKILVGIFAIIIAIVLGIQSYFL